MNQKFELVPGMNLKAFELEIAEKFPELKDDFKENEGLLHLHLSSLYWYCQKGIESKNWEKVETVLRFVEACAKRKIEELENAIRVSFLEYFDFQEDESEIKKRFGPILVELYDDQTKFNAELEKLSASTYQQRIEKREKGGSNRFACPCCGFDTITQPGAFEICKICFWEDDGQDDPIAGLSAGGPNRISLNQGRANFLKYGASDPKDKPHVRTPGSKDERLRKYILVNGKVVQEPNHK